MYNILLIGKPNETFKDVHDFLADKFNVQFGSENPEALESILKFSRPDAILICLIGFYEKHKKIFNLVNSEYPTVPVVTLGTDEEHFRFEEFEMDMRYVNLTRPVKNSEILDSINMAVDFYESMRMATGKIAPGEKRRILVVDDDGASLRSIKAILDSKYDVSVVNSGMKALTSIGKSCPDLIILDYEMPKCDGRRTLEMIRDEDEYSSIPVIFLTGVSDTWHVKAVLELKPAGYLLKPIEPHILLDKVEEVFKKKG